MDLLQFHNERLTKRIEVMQKDLVAQVNVIRWRAGSFSYVLVSYVLVSYVCTCQRPSLQTWLLGTATSSSVRRELDETKEALAAAMNDLQQKMEENGKYALVKW